MSPLNATYALAFLKEAAKKEKKPHHPISHLLTDPGSQIGLAGTTGALIGGLDKAVSTARRTGASRLSKLFTVPAGAVSGGVKGGVALAALSLPVAALTAINRFVSERGAKHRKAHGL